MVTSVTLGIVYAMEEPESDVMTRPPRDPNHPLLDGFIAWKSLFVSLALIVIILGNQEWTLVTGGSRASARATAMTTLVMGQCFYALSARFVYRSSLTYRVLLGNPWLLAAIAFNMGMQVVLTYTPGLSGVWGMDDMSWADWLRCLLLTVAVFLLVELEKWAGPRYLLPLVQPLLTALAPLCRRCLCSCGGARTGAGAKTSRGSRGGCRALCCRCITPSASTSSTTGMPSAASSNEDDDDGGAAAAAMHRTEMRIAKARPAHGKVPPTRPDVAMFVHASRRHLPSDSFAVVYGEAGAGTGLTITATATATADAKGAAAAPTPTPSGDVVITPGEPALVPTLPAAPPAAEAAAAAAATSLVDTAHVAVSLSASNEDGGDGGAAPPQPPAAGAAASDSANADAAPR